MLEICADGRFTEDNFYCYFQQKSAAANESVIPYNLIKRAPELQNLQYRNTEYHPKPNQKK